MKGVAPHIHHYCDDIEVVLHGEVAVPISKRRAILVPRSHIIINRPGAVHGFYAQSESVVILGVRSPANYEGCPAPEEWSHGTEPVSYDKKKTSILDLTSFSGKAITTQYTTVRVHEIHGPLLLKAVDQPERLIVPLGPVRLCSALSGGTSSIGKASIAVSAGGEELTVLGRAGILIVEILPIINMVP